MTIHILPILLWFAGADLRRIWALKTDNSIALSIRRPLRARGTKASGSGLVCFLTIIGCCYPSKRTKHAPIGGNKLCDVCVFSCFLSDVIPFFVVSLEFWWMSLRFLVFRFFFVGCHFDCWSFGVFLWHVIFFFLWFCSFQHPTSSSAKAKLGFLHPDKHQMGWLREHQSKQDPALLETGPSISRNKAQHQ